MDSAEHWHEGPEVHSPEERHPRNKQSVILSGVAIVDSNYGIIQQPELPEGYSYHEISTTGSRPWGVISQTDTDAIDYDWRELVDSLAEDRFLFHELVICVPGASDAVKALRVMLQNGGFDGIDYDDFSLFIQGDARDQLCIIANRTHLKRRVVKQLLDWVEELVEGDLDSHSQTPFISDSSVV